MSICRKPAAPRDEEPEEEVMPVFDGVRFRFEDFTLPLMGFLKEDSWY